MHAPTPLRLASAFAALVLVSREASAQTSGNPGQFGGGNPGQFDPNALPGAQPGAAPPGQFDPNAQPGAGRPGQFDPNAPAGGTSQPPPSFSGPADPNDPNTPLDAAKEEDSGRGITWFWAEVGGGIEHVGIATLSDDRADDTCVQTTTGCATVESSTKADASATGTGPMIDAGLGARLLFFTVGARGRIGFFQNYDLARIGGEVGFRIPIGSLEPRLNAGFGYAALLGDGGSGVYGRLGGGLDYFIENYLAVGADLSGEVIHIAAPTLDRSVPRTDPSGNTFQSDEDATFAPSGTGLGVALGLHVGLHL